MKRLDARLWGAAAIVLLHLVMRALGLEIHTSALAGMPASDWSLLIAAAHVLLYVGAIVVAPVLVLATIFEGVYVRARRALPGGAPAGSVPARCDARPSPSS